MAIILTRTSKFVTQTEDLYKGTAGSSSSTGGAGGASSTPTLQQVVDKEGIVDSTGIIFKNASNDTVKLYLDVDGNLRIEGSLIAEAEVSAWAVGASQPPTVWDALGSHVDDVTIEYVGGELKLIGSVGASTFDALTDTPSTKIADKWLKVNAGGTALEYTNAPTTSTPNLQAVTDISNITTNSVITKSGLASALIGYSPANGGYLQATDVASLIKAMIRSYSINGVQAYFTAGYVGIGTAQPIEPLHIHSGDGLSRLAITDDVTTAALLKGLHIGLDGNQAPFILNYENTPMSFANNGITYMTALADGKVGIGTITPNTPLEVSNNDSLAKIRATRTNGTWTALYAHGIQASVSNLFFQNEFPDGDITVRTHNGTAAQSRWFVDGNANIQSWYNHDGTQMMKINTASGNTDMNLYKSGGATIGVKLNSNGDSYFNGGFLGIGTSLPDSILHLLANTSGGARIKIQSIDDAGIELDADTDNLTESHNPYLLFKQDAGAITGSIGLNQAGFDSVGNAVSNATENSLVIHAPSSNSLYGIVIATNSVARMTISGSGVTKFYQDITLQGSGANPPTLSENTSSTYGNLELLGTSRGGYHGIRLGSTTNVTLMSNDASAGLYWDETNEWGVLTKKNGSTDIRYNGVAKVTTTNNGCQINGSSGTTYALEVNGTVNATDLRATSDRRKKKAISFINDADSVLSSLNGVRYNWRKQFSDDRSKKLGFIAQDVEKTVPESVMIDNDGYYGLNYNSFIPLLVEGWKSHETKIKGYKDTISNLSERIESLERRSDGLS